jgi:8-oxo-dGTP diphosphatase
MLRVMILVVVGILWRNGRVLACQRKKDARYPLKWEFPGGKIEPGETPGAALVRELREELSIDAVVAEELHRQSWVYAEHAAGGGTGAFDVRYIAVRSFTGEPVNRAFEQILWVRPSELERMDILEGNRETIRRLAAYEAEQHSGS